jgi:Kef-type K+ transport system membrane component KefB
MDLNAFQWVLASVGGGALLGVVFLLLLWSARDSDEVVIVVLGMAIFSGGLAAVFHLSPLVVGLVVGVVLSNWRPHQDPLLPMFLRLERPLYVMLLVLAGAAWRYDDPWAYGLAAFFILLKVAVKFLGVRAALAITPLPFAVPPRWWMGLVPQGAIAIAIAMSYALVYSDALSRTLFSAILISTVTLTLISRTLVEAALTDRGTSE